MTTDDLLRRIDAWGPEKVVCVSDPRTGMRGVLVIDNTARGSAKGGTRMSPNVSVSQIARLARVMTWKWAAIDLFHGGAKAGILADPDDPDKERILRAFARRLADQIPSSYVAGLDLGLTERDAAIIQDELGDRGAAVGVPAELGGVPYDALGFTGYGVAEAVDQALTRLGLATKQARVVLQGFGAVGAGAARRLDELGATVVGLSTAAGAVIDPDGLDIARFLALREANGDECVLAAPSARRHPAGHELLAECDVLIPAAVQDVIDTSLAARLRTRILVEGSNLPTRPDARRILAERGITVVPDFIANAGGAIAAGYAMDARYSAFRPDSAAIFATVSTKIRSNTDAVLDYAQSAGVTPHQAALRIAKERVEAAMRLRGQRAE
jgi:glutamate dehydrogenase (NAD(P)+)